MDVSCAAGQMMGAAAMAEEVGHLKEADRTLIISLV
jgi:hypothetical protein